jgi:hypothetical protein
MFVSVIGGLLDVKFSDVEECERFIYAAEIGEVRVSYYLKLIIARVDVRPCDYKFRNIILR